MHYATASSFKEWRSQARNFLAQKILPHQIQWNNAGEIQDTLFVAAAPVSVSLKTSSVPKEFIELAERIACHTDPQRWAYLYETLWCIVYEQKNLLKIVSDPLVHRLHIMRKAISRDAHKTKAFVRFKEIHDEQGPHYIAWHNPDHNVLRLVAPFFKRRFNVMRWTIMTPFETAHWDGQELNYSPGVPKDEAPQDDQLEEMWKIYYKSTFNPARLKIKMMKQEMPVRHWKTLPEAALIPELIKNAGARVTEMIHNDQLNPALKLFIKCGRLYARQ